MAGGYSSGSGTSSQNTRQKQSGSFNQSGTSTNTGSSANTTSFGVGAGTRQAAHQTLANDMTSSGKATDFLTTLMQNPYADPNSPMAQAINHNFQQQLAQARTGDASSTGVAQRGFREGEALAGAQRDLLTEGSGAASTLLAHNNPLSAIEAIKSISNINNTGTGTGTTTTSNSGNNVSVLNGLTNGTSNNSNWGAGLNICCFIFLQSFNGMLPWFVRSFRDLCVTKERARGYRKQAVRLVPLMQQSSLIAKAVKMLMVNRLTNFGGWMTGQNKTGWLNFPFVLFWFSFWQMTGKEAK